MSEAQEMPAQSTALAPSAGNRSSLERAAILMLVLGERDAAAVLKRLDAHGVHKLGKAMTQLGDIKRADVEAVLDRFLSEVGNESSVPLDSSNYLKRLLVDAIGDDKAQEVLERIFGENTNALDKLRWLDARSIAEFVSKEHPQVQAIILSYLKPEHAAEVLDYLSSDEVRADLIMRVATLDSLSPNALREVNDIVEEELVGFSSQRFMTFGGKKVAAEILNGLDTRIEEEVMASIRGVNEALGQEIEDLMFVFADLAEVQDRDIQTLLREVSSDSLKLALKGADEQVKQRILGNISKRAAELLVEDMEIMGPVRLSDVEAAQKEILIVARRLADSGEIMLGNSAEEMV
ncbi:MAG: flagellar motor switch protein FliG [Pseudomonadales bacterium]